MTLPVTLTLVSPATQAAAPFCVGHAFKKGDVPSGSGVVVTGANAQVTAKNAWPDGSLKFAVIAGTASVSTTPATVTLSVGSPSSGTALATADLKATGITAAIDAGAFGSASWSGTDWDTPFQAWVSGHRMSSWVYRKQIGSDAHLVGWLEVRLYAGGAVEVLPWIENGYMMVAGPTNKTATYTFTLGGTQRFTMALDLKHHQRAALLDGSGLSHWVSTDPNVTPKHDKAYLQASELVPSYSANYDASIAYLSSTPSNHDSLIATFTPLARGNYKYDSDSMASGGYQAPIGLLPTHDVAYLTGDTLPELRYGAVVRNGFASGRYCIHYRDENTNRPTTFSAYPTMGLTGGGNHGIKDVGACNGGYTPVPTGGSGPTWDPAHHPSIGYMAYLLTGRFYFVEEVQFAAVANHYCVTDWVRGGGLYNSGTPPSGYSGASDICDTYPQTRTGAWKFRTLVQALTATPDSGDPFRADLITAVEHNSTFFHTYYVAQASNQQGIIKPSEFYPEYNPAGDREMGAIWQQDFVTSAWGLALALDLPISSTAKAKMAAFFAWKAQSVVRRLGDIAGFRFENGGVYSTANAPTTAPNYIGGTGPWYADDAAWYAGTYVGTTLAPSSTTANVLNYVDLSTQPYVGVWGNLHPAISYAVRHGVAGAQAAYERLTGASNYSTLATGFSGDAPVWSVMPLSVPAPPAGINLTGASSAQTATSGTGTITASQMTPGPSVRIGADPDGSVYIGARGLGILGSNIASSGTHGPAPLYVSLDPGDGNNEYQMLVGAIPSGLHLTISDIDGSILDTADADGVYVVPFEIVQNGASVGSSSMLFEFGTTTLTGANSTQSNTSGVGAVGVNPFGSVNLVGDNSSQSATSSAGAIGIPGVVDLVGSGSTQTATSGTGAIVVRDSSASNFAVTVPADTFLVAVPTDESGERGVLAEFVQQTDDVLNYAVSFNTWLATRAVPDTAKAVEVTSEEGITIGSYSLASGVVTLRGVNGSTDGCRYKATLRLTTNGGRVKEVEILIKVKNSYLAVFEKQPTELMDYDISFVDWFSSRSLSNAPDEEPEVLPDDGIVVENSHMANGVQKTWLSGGTDLDAYDISTLVHAGGMLKKATIRIKVRDT